jgi:hypothetical protein
MFGAWSGSSLFQAGNPDDQGDTLMLDESDVTRLWRQLFRGRAITSAMLKEAKLLLNKLSPESPLRVRFSAELEEIRSLHQEMPPKRRS